MEFGIVWESRQLLWDGLLYTFKLFVSVIIFGTLLGILVGWISPGKTFLEPAAGALVAVVPTVWWLVYNTPAAPRPSSPSIS